MTDAQRAELARSLKDNELFQDALDSIRENAREALVSVKATDADTIRDHQAMARAIDELRSMVDRWAVTGAPKKPGLA